MNPRSSIPLNIVFLTCVLTCGSAVWGQTAPGPLPSTIQPGQTENQPPPPDKRVFGVLPNYRTANETAVYTPITAKQKFTIAAKDSFDYPLVGLAAFLAAYQQLENTNPSFGQGWDFLRDENGLRRHAL